MPRRLVAFMLLPLLGACGGGGGGAAPVTLYVRVTGRDTNTGSDSADALKTISKAMQLVTNGSTIYVGAGTYAEAVTTARIGGSAQGLLLLADTGGTRTGDAGSVVIDAQGATSPSALAIAQSAGTVVDGFTMTGSSDAGIVVKSGSDGLTIQNCIVFNNAGDGIRVQDSARALIFNNLVYGNAGIGLNITGSISGSPDARLFNNTVALNGSRGITIGQSQVASPHAQLRNNILYGNTGDSSIKVFTPPPTTIPRSDVGYDEDYDLILPFVFLPTGLTSGTHDLSNDPLFFNASNGDFHLTSGSPAIGAGNAAALSTTQAGILQSRTTTGQGLDPAASDLGFHYLPN